MNTKTCKNCGWVYPITQPGRKCPICGAVYDIIVCGVCHKPTPIEKMESGGSYKCKACAAAEDRVIKARKKQRYTALFDAWLKMVQSVPKNYPTLTEEQWLEACAFFDGCARCSSSDIDARGFFVGAQLGGRYCDWNVIPLCEKCAVNWDLTKEAFRYAEARDYATKSAEHRECLLKIIEYLGGKLDAALGNAGEPTEYTGGGE